MSSAAVAAALALLAQTPAPLVVTATAAKQKVRVHEAFEVSVRIVNVSAQPQTIRFWNVTWFYACKPNNPAVSWEWVECRSNSLRTVRLQPGQAFDRSSLIEVTKGQPGENISFKLGFTSFRSKRTYWSNEVTVQVAKAKP
jgi:hypothetical protein